MFLQSSFCFFAFLIKIKKEIRNRWFVPKTIKILKINEAVMNFEILEVMRVDCITPPKKWFHLFGVKKFAVYRYQLSHVTVFP